jgi:hypothetical protein
VSRTDRGRSSEGRIVGQPRIRTRPGSLLDRSPDGLDEPDQDDEADEPGDDPEDQQEEGHQARAQDAHEVARAAGLARDFAESVDA